MAKNKKLVSALKIVVSLLLIYFIFTKIDLHEIGTVLKKTHFGHLLAALAFFIISKILSAFRVNLYFHEIGIRLTQISNLKLALLGMFYNLFLPGGIGGDAYKGYLLNKEFDVKTKKIVSVLLLDRLSGLLLLFIYAAILAIILDHNDLNQYRLLFLLGMVLAISGFWFLNKRFFSFALPLFWKSLSYSAFVQLAQLVSVVFILKSLAVVTSESAYLFIFLISSIVAVIPLTIGGIGSREITFFYGASLFALQEITSVSISLVFFMITAIVSLFGIYYHFSKPKLATV